MDSTFEFNKVQALYTNLVSNEFPNFETHLKNEQARIIHAVLLGKDVLVTLPTSYGKFLSIISPSLMKSKVISFRQS